MKRNKTGLFLLTIASLGIFAFVAIRNSFDLKRDGGQPTPSLTPTPTPFNPFPYEPPSIEKSRSYLTLLVGDSILGSLGRNAESLRQNLLAYYPDHEFVTYNYGFGATNILSVSERLEREIIYQGETFPPIFDLDFDLIIIGSFAYNPLSQYELEKGLGLHWQTLDKNIREVIKQRPKSTVALLAPIAPNRENFAKGVYELSAAERIQWAEERIAYIQSTIEYAREKQIPLINVYQPSLDEDGDGNLKFINKDDYTHPSEEGIDLIAQTIARFIFENEIFPR